MTAIPSRPNLPPHLQPRKALATSKGTNLSATANNGPAIPRATSQVKVPQTRKTSNDATFADDKATIALVRRWLCSSTIYGDASTAQKPIQELLPPLTSSNEVDLQVYAIIAIIIKDFVYAWYTQITPDHVFVDEVVQIIAHCTRALEQRLRRVDISELILDEIPSLVDGHIQAYRIAIASSNSSPYNLKPRQLYHSLHAHPASDPIPDSSSETDGLQAQNEAVYRQLLIQGTLAVLLPTEDLENICLRTLVSDVIADLLLGQVVSSKVCQPWFLWATISKVIETLKPRIQPTASTEQTEQENRNRLEKGGLSSIKSETSKADSSTPHQSKVSALFSRIFQYLLMSFLFLRFVILGLLTARSARPRTLAAVTQSRSSPSSSVQDKASAQRLTPSSTGTKDPLLPKRPVLDYRLFSMIARLLDLSTRMPWLFGSLSWCQHSILSGAGRIGDPGGTLDRFLSSTISTYVLNPSLLPPLLKQIRITIFPNNSLGPPAPPPPLPAEQLAIRHQCARDILSLIPLPVARRYFAPAWTKKQAAAAATADDEMEKEDMINQISATLLAPFSDEYMNKHLVYEILELVLLRLVPELGTETPHSLLEERVGGF